MDFKGPFCSAAAEVLKYASHEGMHPRLIMQLEAIDTKLQLGNNTSCLCTI